MNDKQVKRMILLEITRKEICFSEPEEKNRAHELAKTDTEIEKETVDCLVIFEDAEGCRSTINSIEGMEKTLKKAANDIL